MAKLELAESQLVTLSVADMQILFDIWNDRAEKGEWSAADCKDVLAQAQAEYFFKIAQELIDG